MNDVIADLITFREANIEDANTIVIYLIKYESLIDHHKGRRRS